MLKIPLIFFLCSIFFHSLSTALDDPGCRSKKLPVLSSRILKKKKGESNKSEISDYPYNPSVSLEVWDQLKPYFLPSNHPIKMPLDLIFQSKRATLSRESFIAAGFEVGPPKNPGNLVVGKHPSLGGYLVKAYLDTQDACEWDNFFKRVTGAQSIQQCIQRHGYQKYFKVPEKWIYPLPLDPSPPTHPQHQKNFVLVVEECHLLNHHENGKAYRGKITPQILDALYIIFTEEGLIDSVYRGNVPFNTSGKMCFIDTEHHHIWPVNYHPLTRYLSPDMQSYWQSLIDKGGP